MRLIPPLLCLLGLVGCGETRSPVVLYCAQDEPFARAILKDFERDAHCIVQPKFDTEADKSVSLYIELVQEKDRPRCDVFWNNEILSTIRLQKQGLLTPYDSPAAMPYPAHAKAKDHTWHALAERARVLIVNKDRVGLDKMPRSIFDLAKPEWKGQVVMAKPHHGTSATQAAALYAVLGSEGAKDYYSKLLKNEIRLAPGNRQVADWVARGETPAGDPVAFGITDSDDAMLELEAGSPIVIVFPDSESKRESIGTLFIPNTVAILKGCPHPERAKKLIDYLLGPEIERKLCEGSGHQIPLNPEVQAKLPAALEPARSAKRMQVDFQQAAEQWDKVQTFLRDRFARPD